MFRRIWKRLACWIADCPTLSGKEREPQSPILDQMESIPPRIDRIIEKRIRNNIIESAYLQRLRDEGDANGD